MNGADGNCDFLHSLDGINNIYALDFYGGNEINQKTLRTFEEMCDDTNLSRLGVLRMDVDNLGKIFKEGLPNGRATLSRYAALSRSFDYFFSGYLNTIWNEVDPNNSFIIYSGGDDVFIVARWDVAIALAKRIRTDFAEFTCQNPNFTISCGISIIPPKYPIMKGAEESAKEENKAKNHTCVNTSKNSISFMGMPMDFYKEFPVVEDLKDQLTNLLSTNRLPKSFISKIMTHFTNADITHHEIKNYKTYWMLTYDLNRMMGRYRADSDIVSIIKNCINEVCCNDRRKLNAHSIETDYHPLELWAFASRWAELEYRNTKE
jgi:CRISPR-associated protein Csm1